ncbi:hypothetical protein Bbelb_222400 [Branchiostoma belcheri]|nr:hypothetical protein Bbelb_222400 [Branchiostoma belcheri]
MLGLEPGTSWFRVDHSATTPHNPTLTTLHGNKTFVRSIGLQVRFISPLESDPKILGVGSAELPRRSGHKIPPDVPSDTPMVVLCRNFGKYSFFLHHGKEPSVTLRSGVR